MNIRPFGLALLLFQGISAAAAESDAGFSSIFDGTLKDWEGDPVYWKAENDTLVGEVAPATLLKKNSFIIWRCGELGDFELKLELQHYINGILMAEVRDEDAENRRMSGQLGVQVHVGPPMKIEFRKIRVKRDPAN